MRRSIKSGNASSNFSPRTCHVLAKCGIPQYKEARSRMVLSELFPQGQVTSIPKCIFFGPDFIENEERIPFYLLFAVYKWHWANLNTNFVNSITFLYAPEAQNKVK